ncbi:MAG: ABC transporter permease [Clostridiaceae bacterium]|nr:ABC transporter permease [Clostridiaceae bacterium]
MKSLIAFSKKEALEWWRSGRLAILVVVFALFGIMNPAFAKLTPWLMESMSESLEKSGIVIKEIRVDALTSWEQFYKNIPIAMMVFILMVSGSFTTEIQKGTFILVLTKGLSRWKVYIAKTFGMLLVWTAAYWICFGITYIYNDFYWDNSVAAHPVLAAAFVYFFGVWLTVMVPVFSAILSNAIAVSIGTGSLVIISYVLGMLPKIKDNVPTFLMGSQSLLVRAGVPEDYYPAIAVTAILVLVSFGLGWVMFDRRRL